MDSEAASSYASSDAEMPETTDWQQLIAHAEKQTQRKKKKKLSSSSSGHHQSLSSTQQQIPASTQQQMVSGASVAPHPHETSLTQPPNNSSAHTSQPTPPATTDATTDDGFRVPKRHHTARPCPPSAPTPLSTDNRYTILTPQETEKDKTSSNEVPTATETTPTPIRRPQIGAIHIDNHGLKYPTRLLTDLQQHVPNSFYAKSTRTELILQAKTTDAHHKILKALEAIELDPKIRTRYFDSNLYYHHHRTTEERHAKLVIKGLSPNIPTTDVLTALSQFPFKIHHVSEMKKRTDTNALTGLGLYVIETNKQETGQIKATIHYLLHHKITIEEYNQTDRIPRCDNCQMLYHTRHYCHRRTICAKCSENHHTSTCTNQTFKCANCNDAHPTYSPDCPVLTKAKLDRQKTLQQSRPNPTNPGRTVPPPNNSEFPSLPQTNATTLQQTFTASTTNQRQSYSSRTRNLTPTPTPSPTSTFSDLKELISLLKSFNISQFITTIKDIITICKSPTDNMTKIITVISKVCELF